MALSLMSFMPILRIENVPGALFLILPLALWVVFDLLLNRSTLNKFEMTYMLYLVASIPSLFLGVFRVGLISVYIYVYSVIAIIFSIALSRLVVKVRYIYIGSFIVLLGLTMLGWVFRLGIIEPNSIFDSATSSEWMLGYWGIRYAASTRNADYFYPLLAAVLANRLFAGRLVKNFVIIFLLATVVLSLSRAGLISAALILLVLGYNQGLIRSFWAITLPLICLVIIGVYYGYLGPETLEIVGEIVESISKGGSKFSNADRITILARTCEEIGHYPFGVGIGNFNLPGLNTASAENAFFTIFLERGWLAGIFFASLLYQMATFKRFWRSSSALTMIVTVIYLSFNYELNNLSMSAMLGLILANRNFNE